MVRFGLILMVALAATGCSRIGQGLGFGQGGEPSFEGQKFRGSTKAQSKDKQEFIASVRVGDKPLSGAVQAAEYKGTQHCMRYYGTSDIVWEVGPDTDTDALVVENGQISLMGRCVDP